MNGEVIGYIESELGSDESQVEKYRTSGKKVYTIYGKKKYPGADLGFDELYLQCLFPLKEKLNKTDQRYWSLLVPIEIIEQFIMNGGYKNANKRQEVPDDMNHAIVKAIREIVPEGNFLKNRLKDGYIKLDAGKEGSLSVGIFSKKSTNNNELKVISKKSTSEDILFPSYGKLLEYTKNEKFANDYAEILTTAGLRGYKDTIGKGHIALDIKRLLKDDNIYKLVDCIKKYCVF